MYILSSIMYSVLFVLDGALMWIVKNKNMHIHMVGTFNCSCMVIFKVCNDSGLLIEE